MWSFPLPEKHSIGRLIAIEIRASFLGAIPKWKQWNGSEAIRVFLEWFQFGIFMKAEWRPNGLNKDKQNIKVVEEFFCKYRNVVGRHENS